MTQRLPEELEAHHIVAGAKLECIQHVDPTCYTKGMTYEVVEFNQVLRSVWMTDNSDTLHEWSVPALIGLESFVLTQFKPVLQ